jgi:hypothetical protein
MTFIWLIPFLLQGMIMGIDEFIFHRKRGLPPWERVGHPVDTFFFAGCLIFACVASPEMPMIKVYAALAVLSCLMITKDEFVHTEVCSKPESWLHAILFILHPIVLIEAWAIWAGAGPVPSFGRSVLLGECLLVCSFLAYQIIYWWTPLHDRQQRFLRSAR